MKHRTKSLTRFLGIDQPSSDEEEGGREVPSDLCFKNTLPLGLIRPNPGAPQISISPTNPPSNTNRLRVPDTAMFSSLTHLYLSPSRRSEMRRISAQYRYFEVRTPFTFQRRYFTVLICSFLSSSEARVGIPTSSLLFHPKAQRALRRNGKTSVISAGAWGPFFGREQPPKKASSS